MNKEKYRCIDLKIWGRKFGDLKEGSVLTNIDDTKNGTIVLDLLSGTKCTIVNPVKYYVNLRKDEILKVKSADKIILEYFYDERQLKHDYPTLQEYSLLDDARVQLSTKSKSGCEIEIISIKGEIAVRT